MNFTQRLHESGQSLGLDIITRGLLTSGTLRRYIAELAVTRLTSYPTIFDHATMNGYICDAVLKKARRQVRQALCFKRVSEDLIQAAPACTAISITSVARPQSLLNSGHSDH